MDVPFILGVDLSAEQPEEQAVQEQKENASPIQRGEGQQIHHRQVHCDQRRQVEDVIHRVPHRLRLGPHLGDGGHDAHRA